MRSCQINICESARKGELQGSDAVGGGGGAGRCWQQEFTIGSQIHHTTLLHNLNQAEKSSYVAHINTYLGEDPFLKKYLPIDPSGNQLFDLIRDGVLLW